MRFLIVTNLYPPQELGGYGRSMADFAWGLLRCGHYIEVLSSDAPYLQSDALSSSELGPSGEFVDRRLTLKGNYQQGVTFITDSDQCATIDRSNHDVLSQVLKKPWDGILVGNVDLLGPELLYILNSSNVPILHHIGFMDPPFPSQFLPSMRNYTLVTASEAVRSNLQLHGWPVVDSPVVYPGVRSKLFGDCYRPLTSALRFAQGLQLAGHPLGTSSKSFESWLCRLVDGD